jgi:beta-galactosidase
VHHATDKITFDVSGAGELVATDNGDPVDFTLFLSNQRKAFRGLALAIVRSKTAHGINN